MVIRAALFIATTVRWQDGVFMEVAPPFSSSGPHVVCGVVCVCVWRHDGRGQPSFADGRRRDAD